MGGSSGKVTGEFPRKRPRRCIGCGTEQPKRALVRVVRSPDGTPHFDPTGKAPGRGAYLCGRAECLRQAMKKNALSRALKMPIPQALYRQLEEICVEQDDWFDE